MCGRPVNNNAFGLAAFHLMESQARYVGVCIDRSLLHPSMQIQTNSQPTVLISRHCWPGFPLLLLTSGGLWVWLPQKHCDKLA